MLRYTTRPISDRTWLGSMGQEATRFSAKWGSTLEILERELEALQARDVVLEIDVSESDLRLDGTLRANARPSSSAVALAFESMHGPLIYRCDRFFTSWSDQGPEWQHNVRAIALTLEALRAVDRYGATELGQQYTGFKALPAGRAMPASHMTRDDALQLMAELNGIPVEHLNLDMLGTIWKHARRKAHPDRRDGDRTLWDQVEQAGAVLGVAS
jgi:hypothetical protein